MNLAEKCLGYTGLFEAELLLELMLRHWRHPLADDAAFRSALLESAASALRAAASGEHLMEDLPSHEMNLIAAVWYVEWIAISGGDEDPGNHRKTWLDTLRKAVPSCFCGQDHLDSA